MVRQGLATFIKNLVQIMAARPEVPPPLKDNALLRTILNRRSIRKFSQAAIPDPVLQAILEAGRLAPSAVNFQTWSFAVFTEGTWREAFGESMPFGGSRAIMVLADAHRGRKALGVFPRRPLLEYTMAVMNASLAAMNMNIAAEALGVGSVMTTETGRSGYLDALRLKDKLSLPDGVFPLMTLVLGYPRSGRPVMPPKWPIDEVCFTGRYREAEPKVVDDWLGRMAAGFKAAHPGSSLDDQLAHYRSLIDQAENGLRRLVFYGDGEGADDGPGQPWADPEPAREA